MYNRIFFFFFLFSAVGLKSQQVRVLDADKRDVISNVAIYNSDKSKVALTDFDGLFDITIFSKNERIAIRHISYELLKTSRAQIVKQGNKVLLIMKPEQLDEVVMSVSKWEQQKKDIPNKIASIAARDIAFAAPQTSADLLQNSGKVFVQKSQLGGGSPMIRGFSTNRLVLSVDGVRMNNAIFRGGNLQNVISIDPFTIKNTEIIFGPGSVIYGSDAIGGVMNFYTQTPEFSENDSLLVYGGANYRFSSASSENTINAKVGIGKKKWATLTSLTYNSFQDLVMGSYGPDSYLRNWFVHTSNGVDELVANENPRKQVSTGYSQVNLMQKVRFRPNAKWDVRSGIFYSETTDYPRYDRLIRPSGDGLGLRSAVWFYGPQKWFMSNLQLNKKGDGQFYDGLKLSAAYQRFEESRNNRNFQDITLNSSKEKVDAFNFNIDLENRKIGDFRLYYGGEFIFNKVHSEAENSNIVTGEITDAPTRYPNGSSWQSLAGYVNSEYRAKPNFTLMSGVRYSHVWIDALFNQNFYSFPFNDANLSTGALTGSIGFSWFPKTDLQVTFNGST
ncbi:MAG: hemoglobin/transferrin/lactoferrin receptor protein, partial [Maribacter sp.]